MWKEHLKRLIPIFRHRPTVLRLHQWLDWLRGLPATLRLNLYHRGLISPAILRNERRIVFVSDKPLRREAKFAYALKRAGWDVILLTKATKYVFDTSDYTDVQYYGSSAAAAELAFKTRARLFHHFSPSYDNTTRALIAHKPGRILVDFYDYFYALSDGMLVREKYALEIKYQRECIDGADGVVTPDLQLQYDRRDTRIARGKPLICFPNYCWDRDPLPPSRDEGEIHIVQIGWMGFEKNGEEDIGCFRVIKTFVDAGCQFHIYLHPGFPEIESLQFKNLFEDYLELRARTGRLHFHATVPAHQLVRQLATFDYGFNMMNGPTFGLPWKHHNPHWLPLLASGRIFDYLDAGLPTLNDGILSFNRHIFGSPAFIDGTAIVRNGNIRGALEHRPTRREMLSVRERLSVGRHIHRLVRFYESFGT